MIESDTLYKIAKEFEYFDVEEASNDEMLANICNLLVNAGYLLIQENVETSKHWVDEENCELISEVYNEYRVNPTKKPVNVNV